MYREEYELPAVLIQSKPFSTISIVRALKNILEQLERLPDESPELDDRRNSAIDDCQTMIKSTRS